jgi:hypothetical protein
MLQSLDSVWVTELQVVSCAIKNKSPEVVRAVCSKLSFQYSGWAVTGMLALVVLFSLV